MIAMQPMICQIMLAIALAGIGQDHSVQVYDGYFKCVPIHVESLGIGRRRRTKVDIGVLRKSAGTCFHHLL